MLARQSSTVTLATHTLGCAGIVRVWTRVPLRTISECDREWRHRSRNGAAEQQSDVNVRRGGGSGSDLRPDRPRTRSACPPKMTGPALLLGDREATVAETNVISWGRPGTCKRRLQTASPCRLLAPDDEQARPVEAEVRPNLCPLMLGKDLSGSSITVGATLRRQSPARRDLTTPRRRSPRAPTIRPA